MSDTFSLIASSYDEGLRIARERYGPNIYFLSHRNIQQGGFLGIGSKMMVEINGVIVPPKEKPASSAAVGPSREDIQRYKDELLQKTQGNIGHPRQSDKFEEILTVIKREFRELENTIKDKGQHPNEKLLVKILKDNDFPDSYIDLLVVELKNKLSVHAWEQRREVELAALDYISRTIVISPAREENRPRVHVLVGPTGVGKTTTIAKLAYYLGEWQNKRAQKKLALINLDDQRVEAQATLNKYGEYMNLPVHFCASIQELERSLALTQECDHVLVDTAGHSPKNFSELAQEKKMIDSIRERYECLLTISAVTKTIDLENIVQNYAMFQTRDAIVTKVDETTGIGNIIGVLWENKQRIRYLSCGQTVPTDFSLASKFEIMKNLVNFSENVIKEFLKELNNG